MTTSGGRDRVVRRGVRPSSADIDAELLDLTAGLLARHGVQATSMSMVAVAAGYSKAAIFRRFGDKDRLIDAALRRCVELGHEASARLDGGSDAGSRGRAALRVMVDAASARPGFIALALTSITIREHDEFDGRLAELGDTLLRMFDLPPLAQTIDPAPLYRALGALSAVAVLTLFRRDLVDEATSRRLILDTADAALRGAPPHA